MIASSKQPEEASSPRTTISVFEVNELAPQSNSQRKVDPMTMNLELNGTYSTTQQISWKSAQTLRHTLQGNQWLLKSTLE